MSLKMVLENLDGLDEGLRSLYEEKDGKFHLKLDGYEDPGALLRAKQHEKEARKKAEDELRDVRKELTELKDRLDNESDDKNRKKGDVAAIEESWRKKLEAREAELKGELGKRDETINRLLVDNVATRLAGELSDSPELLEGLIRARLRVHDGETRVVDEKGELSAATIEELAKEFRENKKYAAVIRGSQANGGGSNGGGNGARGTKAFKDLSEKERTELSRTNPAEFRRLADAHKAENQTSY